MCDRAKGEPRCQRKLRDGLDLLNIISVDYQVTKDRKLGTLAKGIVINRQLPLQEKIIMAFEDKPINLNRCYDNDKFCYLLLILDLKLFSIVAFLRFKNRCIAPKYLIIFIDYSEADF